MVTLVLLAAMGLALPLPDDRAYDAATIARADYTAAPDAAAVSDAAAYTAMDHRRSSACREGFGRLRGSRPIRRAGGFLRRVLPPYRN